MPDQDLARNRAVWAAVNDAHTRTEADARWQCPEVEWGLFRRPERTLGVLGDPAGLDVVELGCGTAYLGAALARAGARVVAVDLSHDQLLTAADCRRRHGPPVQLVEADGARVPLRDASADLVVSEYGAAPWCRPAAWLAEAARLLRPGGRLVFLTNSVLAGMCVPAEGGVAGDRLLRPQADLERIRWPGGGVEHHPGHGTWIRHLRAAGLRVEALHELTARPGDRRPDYYEIVTPEWAAAWPAEDLWVARRPGSED